MSCYWQPASQPLLISLIYKLMGHVITGSWIVWVDMSSLTIG